MNDLYEWAIRNHVSGVALHELMAMFGTNGTAGQPDSQENGMSEAAVQNNIRLEAARSGCRLWRNNVGAMKDERGVPVRYGLANDTAQVNKVLKSSDLIGIRPVLITQAHVGRTIGQFLAREVKHRGWNFTGGEHETAQFNFIKLVTSLGGDAQFANSEGTL